MKIVQKSLLSLVFAGCFTSLAQAQAMPERVPFNGASPVVDGVGSLTVSGGDYWHKARYEDGEQPALSSYDSNGQALPDGNYRFEFRSAVPGSLGEKAQQVQSLHGSFTVSSGAIAFN